MAIIIPSKNIYEINNQKVVDNEVDNIEISARKVINNNEYNVVVYEDAYSNSTTDGSLQEKRNFVHSRESSQRTSVSTTMAFSYVSVLPKYMNVEITIKKQYGNKRIVKIKKGTDANGEAEIKYQLRGNIIRGNATDTVQFTAFRVSSNQNIDYSAIYSTSPSEFLPTYESETEEIYTLPQTITKNAQAFDVPCDVSINVSDSGNVKNPTVVEETDEQIKLSIKVLVGADIYKLATGTYGYDWTFPQRWGSVNTNIGDYDGAVNATSPEVSMSGEYEHYFVSSVEFTIYGNTIGIDLQDETVKIGDGQHVYSFSGNELMQTTNSPSIEENYNKVINGWKSGRETAVLRCSIDNYYSDGQEKNEIEIQMIRESMSTINVYLYFTNESSSTHKIYENDRIRIGSTTFLITNTNARIQVHEGGMTTYRYAIQGTLVTGDRSYGFEENKIINVDLIHENPKKISVTGKGDYPIQNNLPLTFNVGDTVIPYVMGADGNDKPMSLYPDKTQKVFLVIGKGIIADGQIMQELTLQEIPQKSD